MRPVRTADLSDFETPIFLLDARCEMYPAQSRRSKNYRRGLEVDLSELGVEVSEQCASVKGYRQRRVKLEDVEDLSKCVLF